MYKEKNRAVKNSAKKIKIEILEDKATEAQWSAAVG